MSQRQVPGLSRVRTDENKRLWLNPDCLLQPCFMIEQLTRSLSQRACVRANKEADCCCPPWFIPLSCPPSALDEMLIKTLPCLRIPSQTARANHLPPFTTFIISFWTTPQLKSKWAAWRLYMPSFFQLQLTPHYQMQHVLSSSFHSDTLLQIVVNKRQHLLN